MAPYGVCINCGKIAVRFGALCEECEKKQKEGMFEHEETLDEALERNKKMAQRTQRKLRIQDKIMKSKDGM